jgi:hypothetical protein
VGFLWIAIEQVSLYHQKELSQNVQEEVSQLFFFSWSLDLFPES